MMKLLSLAAVAALLLVISSAVAALTYGRFAKRARGVQSFALPLSDNATQLDRNTAELFSRSEKKNGLILLSENLDAFAARALTARGAERSLDLLYYIWHSDLTGQLLFHEIISAADRGVRVRLLLDDVNVGGSGGYFHALDSHENIEIRLFNPSRARDDALRRGLELAFRAYSATRRMHNKIWLADGRVAIVGGRNIGDEYFDAAESTNFRDLDVALLGDAVQDTEAVFDQFWNSGPSIPISYLRSRQSVSLNDWRISLKNVATGAEARPFQNRVAQRTSAIRMLGGELPIYWSDSVRVVSDPPEKAWDKNKGNWIMEELIPVLVSVEESLEIISPYFVPGDEGTGRLVEFVENGIGVSVLTNSLAATDVAAVHGGYAPYRKPLLRGGVKLYELKPDAKSPGISFFGSSGASLHTKAFTVDERVGFVGSFNFDPRSVNLNTEMGVLFENQDLIRQLKELFAVETSREMSYELSLESDKLVWKGEIAGRDTVFHREPQAPLIRRIIARIVGWLPIQSQL